MICAKDAVEDVQDDFAADDGVVDDGGDEGAAGVERARGVTAADVVDEAVGEVLEGEGDAGGLVVFEDAEVDHLVDVLGDEFGEIAAAMVGVGGIGAGQDDGEFDVLGLVVHVEVAWKGVLLVGAPGPRTPSGATCRSRPG